MNEQQAVCESHRSAWEIFVSKVSRKTWWWTSPVAYWVYKRAHKYEEPYRDQWPRLWWVAMNGLAVGCWTHVCGHGLKYSLHMAMIWWNPQTK